MEDEIDDGLNDEIVADFPVLHAPRVSDVASTWGRKGQRHLRGTLQEVLLHPREKKGAHILN